MLILFWISLCFIVYTFFGYPALLWALGRGLGKSNQRARIWPKVSFIVVACNAANVVRSKLQNTLQLDYPRERLEIVVVSDGSSDNTAEIVGEFASAGVTLIEMRERCGKGYAQMVARDSSGGEILAFTDASVLLEPCSLQKIVENFADRSVGVVSSEDVVEVRGGEGAGEGSYVSGEMKLRRLESRLASVVGVSGSFFAARREVCEVWYPNLPSDFFVPLQAVARGFRAVVDRECQARFAAVSSKRAEFQRKVRTIVRGLNVLFSHLRLLNPFRYGLFSWQLASHKLFRWLLPFAFAALLISNFFLWRAAVIYQAFLLVQLSGYGLGFLVWILDDRLGLDVLKLPAFFLMGNAATLVAWINFSLGKQYVIWEPSRRS